MFLTDVTNLAKMTEKQSHSFLTDATMSKITFLQLSQIREKVTFGQVFNIQSQKCQAWLLTDKTNS